MPEGVLRERDGHEARVTPLELFFDLVFVFAITQLSHYLLEHLTPLGIARTLVMFLGTYWVWNYTAWALNWLDPHRVSVRLLIFALMTAALVLAMSVAEAFGRTGLSFALALVFIQIGRSLFTVWALRGVRPENHRNFVRITLWFLVSGVLWIAGGVAGADTRLILWLAALAVEFLGPPLNYYVPRLGRSRSKDWDIEGAHLAERHGLFIIILLGESIIITGSTASRLEWDGTTVAAFATAFLGTVALWWIYFNIGAERASHHIQNVRDPGRYARLVFNYIHLPIIAGILASAAADELILLHPEGHLDLVQAAVVLGGPLLFLTGNMLFKRTTARFFPLSHLVGIGLLLTWVNALPYASPLVIGMGTTAILMLVATWETWSFHSGPEG